MKPGDLYTDFASYIADAKGRFDPTKAKARQSYENGSAFLKKVRFSQGATYSFLYPLELCLPFDPETLSEEVFNRDNPMPLPGSPSSAVLMLRKMCANNEAFKNKLVALLDVKEDKLKIDSDTIEPSDCLVWHKLARIQYVTGYVQHLNTKKESFRFGRNIGCDVILDEDGNVVGTKGVGYRLFELETAYISMMIQQERDTYKPGGVNENKPTKDLDTTISSFWKNRLIGNPYQIAFTRIYVFKTDSSHNVDQTEIEEWNKSRKLSSFAAYQKLQRDRILTLEKSLPSRANDVNMDFLEVTVTVPPADDGKTVNYMAISYNAVTADTSVFAIDRLTDKPINKLDGFKEEYKKLRDDPDKWSDKELTKSIFEFRIPSDNSLLSEVNNSLSIYDSVMNSSSIMTEYSDIISQLPDNFGEKVAMSILENDNDATIDTEIIKSAPIDTDSTVLDEENVGNELSDLIESISEE